MRPRPAAEAAEFDRRAKRIRMASGAVAVALVFFALLAVAWLGTQRLSLTPEVLPSNSPRPLGRYLMPADGLMELALELRAGGSSRSLGIGSEESLRAEFANLRPVLAGCAELAFYGDGTTSGTVWLLHVPLKASAASVSRPLSEFLDSTIAIAPRDGPDRAGAKPFGYYSFSGSSLFVASQRGQEIPAVVRLRTRDELACVGQLGSRWRYFTAEGYFHPRLAAALEGTPGAGLKGPALILWRPRQEMRDDSRPMRGLGATAYAGARSLFDEVSETGVVELSAPAGQPPRITPAVLPVAGLGDAEEVSGE